MKKPKCAIEGLGLIGIVASHDFFQGVCQMPDGIASRRVGSAAPKTSVILFGEGKGIPMLSELAD